MGKRLNVAVLEPYYGGSHAAFVDTLVETSRHVCRLWTLPARKWKWRMRGAALWFARECGFGQGGKSPRPDIILGNDMLSVADLRAFLPRGMRDIPIVCYFHENQLTYPLSPDDRRDFQYGMTNIMSAMATDAVCFNSTHHRDAFLNAAAQLLGKMPDHVPKGVVDDIRAKSAVVSPPVNAELIYRDRQPLSDIPTILWCHRWEYDKNPEAFFGAVLRLHEAGRRFRLVLTGEQFRTAPPVFADSWTQLSQHFYHTGFLPSRSDYLAMLVTCDIVVSTAIQENFGIAVVEAILSGCQPVLPNRLAYPEIIPQEYHSQVLYRSDVELYERLRSLLDTTGYLGSRLRGLQESLHNRYSAHTVVPRMDEYLSRIAEGRLDLASRPLV